MQCQVQRISSADTRSSALVFAIITFVCATAGIGCATSPSKSPEEIDGVLPAASTSDESTSCLPKNVGVRFSDRVPLEDLRFLLRRGDRNYIELTYDDTWQAHSAFCHKFPDSPPYGFGTELPPNEQAWILARCVERIGDTFCCYDVLSGETVFAHLQAIASYHEGGDGDLGFVGLLDIRTAGAAKCVDGLFGERVVGVAYPAKRCGVLKSKPTVPVDAREKQSIDAILRAQSGDETCYVLDAVKNPKDGAVLAVAEHDRVQYFGELVPKGDLKWTPEHLRTKSVFLILPTKSRAKVVPFTHIPWAINVEPEQGFPMDEYPGHPENMRITFLPDMDRDGRNEIFVSASEGFIYQIVAPKDADDSDNRIHMRLIRNFFYGMRE